MSNFLKRGKRIQTRIDNKEVKKRTKDFYKILNELDIVAKEIIADDKHKDATKENIAEIAADYTDREIADMEKFLLLGKIQSYNENKGYI